MQKSSHRNKLFRFLGYALFAVAIYVGHNGIQSYLSQRVLDDLELTFHSFEDASTLSQETGKPILLEIAALWCPSCRIFDREVLGDKRVQQTIHDHYILARLNHGDEETTAFQQKHGIRGYPTLLLLDSEGNITRNLNLTFDPELFLISLNQPLNRQEGS